MTALTNLSTNFNIKIDTLAQANIIILTLYLRSFESRRWLQFGFRRNILIILKAITFNYINYL